MFLIYLFGLSNSFILKSQLGAQFDGYCSTVATTIVVGAKAPVTGAKADVIKAAETALEAAIRLIRPGNKVNSVEIKKKKKRDKILKKKVGF